MPKSTSMAILPPSLLLLLSDSGWTMRWVCLHLFYILHLFPFEQLHEKDVHGDHHHHLENDTTWHEPCYMILWAITHNTRLYYFVIIFGMNLTTCDQPIVHEHDDTSWGFEWEDSLRTAHPTSYTLHGAGAVHWGNVYHTFVLYLKI